VIELSNENQCVVLSFTTATLTDPEQIENASKKIRKYIAREHPKAVVVDFDGVKFFSSQILGMLLAARKEMGGEDKVFVSAIDPQMYRVFKITKLDRIFRFFPDRITAIEAVKKN